MEKEVNNTNSNESEDILISKHIFIESLQVNTFIIIYFFLRFHQRINRKRKSSPDDEKQIHANKDSNSRAIT